MLSVGRWIHVLIAHLLLTAGKKMSLDKSLQVHAKSWKITFKPLKGAHIDGYANKEMKVEKKKKIVNNKHLSLKNLYLPEQRRHACTAQAHHLTGGCANVSHSLNKTS